MLLRIRLPALRHVERLLDAARRDLTPHHAAYVARVSTPVMALSIEASAFILALCRALRPHAVADLGSGFSSFVLRLYAAEAGAGTVVHTVDDSAEWLERTGEFLRSRGLAARELHLWEQYRQNQPQHSFRIVLHDLGNMDTRREALPFVARMCGPRGIVVLDDMHKKEYAHEARKTLRAAGLHVYQARRFTLDSLGRFAELALR